MPSYGAVDLEPLLRDLREESRPRLELVPEPGAMPALAMLAGSFDPITVGHEALAREAVARVGSVALVYSARTLPKDQPANAALLSEEDRLNVLAAFCESRADHVLGLASHGLLSEQVLAASERFPNAELWLVMGSDKVLQVLDPAWYRDRDGELGELFAKARVLYAERAGHEGRVRRVLSRPDNRRWRDRFERMRLPGDVVAVSSRLVRELVRKGEAVSHLVPAEVRAALRAG